jgi:hypothetical protein
VSGANTYVKALADTAPNAEVVGVVTSVTGADDFTFRLYGISTTGVPAGTAGDVYFLSDVTPGLMTTTEPTTIGHVSKPVAILVESSLTMEILDMRGAVIGSQTQYNYVATAIAYLILQSDYTIECTANTFTVTLPTAVGLQGKVYNVKNSGAGVITLAADGAELIDGLGTQPIPAGSSVAVQSNNVGWIII